MRLKRWKIALILSVGSAILWGFNAAGQQVSLSEKLIRFHVVADSDSERDQKAKLMVRDAVLKELDGILQDVSARDEAFDLLEKKLGVIADTANSTLKRAGTGDTAAVTLVSESFPTRYYDTFALPAGKYTSLRITIGEGAGHNWWCVVFPPLCTTAAVEETAVDSFSADELRLITDDSGETVIKFKTLEIIARIKDWCSGG